ncbi:MAG TPA: hypothetical protein VIK89_02900 [Cytophagaceae bacterium]
MATFTTASIFPSTPVKNKVAIIYLIIFSIYWLSTLVTTSGY